MIARARVVPFASCPKSAKSFDQTSFHALMRRDHEPHVGSQIRDHGALLVSFAIRVDTSGGVKNSPAFLPASLAKLAIRNSYTLPIISLPSRCFGARLSFSLLKSVRRLLSLSFLAFGSHRFELLKSIFLNRPEPSSLLSFSLFASSKSINAVLISSPILLSFL
jgi:hypothetical protein